MDSNISEHDNPNGSYNDGGPEKPAPNESPSNTEVVDPEAISDNQRTVYSSLMLVRKRKLIAGLLASALFEAQENDLPERAFLRDLSRHDVLLLSKILAEKLIS